MSTMSIDTAVLALWTMLVGWTLGQIWLAQIVVYPLFAHVGEPDYLGYHRFYTSRIPLPVILPGFLSFLLPIPLSILGPSVPVWMIAANIAVGLCGLLVTVMLAIPRHTLLEKNGKDTATIAELVRFNWLRTASITAQALIAFVMLMHVAGR
jgi:hypothetical protein